ncbi:MAG: hypothetical protein F6K11_16395, partial [Leptolyngbya sp. SIO3F4]|nr:hypothetical protein [Leptolyngbya sp. SIO3F4]
MEAIIAALIGGAATIIAAYIARGPVSPKDRDQSKRQTNKLSQNQTQGRQAPIKVGVLILVFISVTVVLM